MVIVEKSETLYRVVANPEDDSPVPQGVRAVLVKYKSNGFPESVYFTPQNPEDAESLNEGRPEGKELGKLVTFLERATGP